MKKQFIIPLLFIFLSLPLYSNKNNLHFIETLEYKWGDLHIDKLNIDEGKWIPLKSKQLLQNSNYNLIWYKFLLPKNANENQAIYLSKVFTYFEVYVENKKFYQFGDFSKIEKQEFLGYPWHIIPLKSEYFGKKIYIRVYSPTHLIGIRDKILIEEPTQIIKMIITQKIHSITIGFFAIIFGILLTLVSHTNLKIEYKFLGIYSILLGIICFSVSDINQLLYGNSIFWYHAFVIPIYLAPISSTAFIKIWLQKKYHRFFKGFFFLHIVLAILCITILIFNINVFNKLFLPTLYILLISEFVRLFFSYLSFRKKDLKFYLFLISFTIFLLFTLWDILAFANIIDYNSTRLFPFGVFQFILLQLYILNNYLKEIITQKDIYERNLENKITEGNRQLTKTKFIKEDAQRIMRHDLKMPLSGIIGYSELLLSDSTLKNESKELAESILKSGHKMRYMINNSLDLFKMEEGVYELTPVMLNFIKMFAKINDELMEFQKAKPVRLIYYLNNKQINWSETLLYAGESIHLENLFANLIKNAIEASPENSEVSIRINDKNNYIETIIHNKGEIPTEIRDKFFQRYTTKGKKGGTGIGTYSAYLITKAHKGDIGFITSQKKGTQLVVKLPKFNAT